MASPTPDPLAAKRSVIKSTPTAGELSATARSDAGRDDTATSPAEAPQGTQATAIKARRVGRDRGFTAADLSRKLIENIYDAFCENPDCDRLADQFHVPKLTILEAVNFALMLEIRKPPSSETWRGPANRRQA